MDCNEARRRIVPYIKQQLSMDETYLFINHVQECSECKDELEIYYIMEHGLSDEEDAEEDGHILDFTQRLNQQLVSQKKDIEDERFRMGYYQLAYVVASIALIFVTGLFVILYIL